AQRGAGGSAVISLAHYLTVAAILFTIGVLGIFLNRRNVILMLMAIELILLAVTINLVAFSAYLGDLTGQVLAMFVLTVAAAEAAIVLAILVIFFRSRGSIAVADVDRPSVARDVAVDEQRPPAVGLDPRDRLATGFLVHVECDERRAFGGEERGTRRADSGRRAGDQSHTPVELPHQPTSSGSSYQRTRSPT